MPRRKTGCEVCPMDMEFFMEIGKTLSLLFVMIFFEGVISGRKNGKWPGFLFATMIFVISIIVGVVNHSGLYFLFMMVPTAICYFVYFVSRRNVARGGGYQGDDQVFDDYNE